MPYKVSKKGSGYKVTSPNHPHGFSKKPQSKQQAIKQKVAIEINSKEEKPQHHEWAAKVKGQKKN